MALGAIALLMTLALPDSDEQRLNDWAYETLREAHVCFSFRREGAAPYDHPF